MDVSTELSCNVLVGDVSTEAGGEIEGGGGGGDGGLAATATPPSFSLPAVDSVKSASAAGTVPFFLERLNRFNHGHRIPLLLLLFLLPLRRTKILLANPLGAR